MTATETLAHLRTRGLAIALDGTALVVSPRALLAEVDKQRILAHLADLKALVQAEGSPASAAPIPERALEASATAAIVLLADAHSRDGDQLLEAHGLRPAGLNAADLRREFMLPPGITLGALMPADVAGHIEALHQRLAALPAPAVLVPTGPLGLAALRRALLPVKPPKKPTKKHPQLTAGPTWRVKDGDIAWPDTIPAFRGFVDGYVDLRGRTHTVVATHPASALWWNPQCFDDLQADWRRIAEEAPHPGDLPPAGADAVAGTAADLDVLLRHAEQAPLLAFDIETDRRRTIYCCGFAWDGSHAMTIPLVAAPEHGWSESFIAECWATVRALLALPVPKVAHNQLFDIYHLAASQGITVAAADWCTLAMHHQLDPNRPHSLAYAASRELRVSSWKGTGKFDEDENRTRKSDGRKVVQAKDLVDLATDCAADCRNTWALQRVLEQQLVELDLLETYADHHRAVNAAALELSLTGLPVDDAARQQHADRLDAELGQLRTIIARWTGRELIAAKAASPTRVVAYLFGPPPDGLGCDVTHRTKTGNPSTDEIALRRLMLRDPRMTPVVTLLLAYAEAAHLRAFVDAARVDADGRMRSLYRPVVKSGRCCSAATPLATGTNAQNYPHTLRDIFLAAHPGWLFVQLDLSQAESRIVDGCSSNPRALELARTPPDVLDQHKLLASEVLKKPIAEVTKEERQVVGKKGRHALNYGERGATMSDTLLKERIIRTPEECQDILDGVLAARPYIRRWQEWVWATGARGVLVNSWGCRYVTETFEPTHAMRREWLAWGPQGEVARLLTQKGWLPAREIIRRDGLRIEIVHQGHDSIVFHGPVAELFDLCAAVAASLSAPRTYPGVDHPWELSMPVGWGLGRTLGTRSDLPPRQKLHEWKAAPSRAEFLEIAQTCTGSTVAEPVLLQAAG